MLLKPALYFDGMKKLILNVPYPGITPESPGKSADTTIDELNGCKALASAQNSPVENISVGNASPTASPESNQREKCLCGKMELKPLFGEPPVPVVKAKGILMRQYAAATVRENRALSSGAKFAVVLIYVVIGVIAYFICVYTMGASAQGDSPSMLESVAKSISPDPSVYYRAMLHSAFGAI